MSKAITMADLEAINFPYYYNLVKEGKMKAKEVYDLLFNGNDRRYSRYKNVMEGKQATSQKRKEYMKEYYENNKDKKKDYQKERYENNKEAVLNKQKEYREANKDKRKEYNKEQYESNKEYYKNKNKERYESNKEYWKERYESKAQQEIDRIKHNYTNLLYPHCGTQYGIIYKVQNVKNGKTYIGQTTKSFDLRYDGDFFTNKFKEIKNEELKADFYQDLEMFGVGAFMVQEVLDVAFSPMELDEKEVYWIDYYKAYEEGYNSNRGFYNGRTTVYNKWIEEHPEYEEYKNIFGVYLLEDKEE